MSTLEYTKKELPKGLMTIGLGLLVVGLVLIGINFATDASDHHGRFWRLYVTGFVTLTSVALGASFIIAVEHVAGAYWSVPNRRILEILCWLFPVLGVLGLPLLMDAPMEALFHWLHPEGDHLLEHKAPYLNRPFFTVRYFIYFISWTFAAWFFHRNSVRQEETKDQAITTTNLRFGALYICIFALTSSFFAIDWVMSLEAHWFSTMFGIYYFAGTMCVGFSVFALFYLYLKNRNVLHPGLGKDHLYPIANFMFAFAMFWTYIGFCQFMLIWYAGMGEETMYYIPRWEGDWKAMAIIMMIAKFPVPFFVLVGRMNKTREKVVQFMAYWLIFWHFVDMYWNVMPSLKDHSIKYDKLTQVEPTIPFSFNILDAGWLLFGAGLVMVVFYLKGRKGNMVPVGDPKLEHGLHWHA